MQYESSIVWQKRRFWALDGDTTGTDYSESKKSAVTKKLNVSVFENAEKN